MMLRYLRYLERHGRAAACRAADAIPDWWRHCVHPQTMGEQTGGWYAHFSTGMEKIPDLAAFAGKPVLRLPLWPGTEKLWPRLAAGCCGVLTWGLKDKKQRAARFSARFDLPLLRLEDGFLRSLDLGVNGAAPLSVVRDGTGIYYDATRPSDLENLLNSTGWESPELLEEARAAIQAIVAHKLSKYSHAPEMRPSLLPDTGRKRVLVLDQTANDLSVSLGMADAETFRHMLHAALAENPGADVYVKTHPDVLSGKKEGFYDPIALPQDVHLIAEDVAPLSLLERADVVYAVSSQMGFEALMLGKVVHCFGMPFYAGWGLTRDRQRLPRRKQRRTLEEVFAAAYLKYPRYVHPASGQVCGIQDIISLLTEQRRINERNAGYHACVGFRFWKRSHARAFLSSTRGTTEFFCDEGQTVTAAKQHNGDVVSWASREPEDTAKLCAVRDVPLRHMEDGFLRSVGLGSDYFRPGSLVLDDAGMYYDPSRPSTLETLLQELPTEHELSTARRLRDILIQRNISKYNVTGVSDLPVIPADKTVVLVPGQVEDDASVRLGGCGITTNLALLRAVRTQRPDAFIIYKEHPDVVKGNRPGRLDTARANGLADAVIYTAPIEHALSLCHEVHTLTSLTGFEALIRGIPVWTYGGPFYAGWGLTTDRVSFSRRCPLPSVEHLMVGALLRYPAYYDWNSRQFLDCLSFVQCLDAARAAESRKGVL